MGALCDAGFEQNRSAHFIERRIMRSAKKVNLRGIVLTWTLLTTIFFWTSTMRLLLKPEISSWKIFAIGGKGGAGAYWVLPLVVLLALFAFYLEGRGRLRPLYHILLVGWHLAITGLCVYGALQPGSTIHFGAWGIRLSLVWLVVPFAIFLLLAVLLVIQESRGVLPVPVFGWSQIDWKKAGAAALLLPVAFVFFRLGSGFDLMVKIAIVVTVVQWILLVEALGRPDSKTNENT